MNKPLTEETVSIEKQHGRIDGREYHVLPAGALAEQFPEWKNLKSVGVAISYRIEKMKKISMEYRYYISSAELTPEQFSSAVRGHWAIENSLHWVLDVVMNEDACQIYRGDAPQILASVHDTWHRTCCGPKPAVRQACGRSSNLRA